MDDLDERTLAGEVRTLVSRVVSLEVAVRRLLDRTAKHEQVIRLIKAGALVLLGVGLGTGLVQLKDVFGFFK